MLQNLKSLALIRSRPALRRTCFRYSGTVKVAANSSIRSSAPIFAFAAGFFALYLNRDRIHSFTSEAFNSGRRSVSSLMACRSVYAEPSNHRPPLTGKLFQSAVKGDIKLLKSLLDKEMRYFNVNSPHEIGGWSLFHVAAINGHSEMVEFLLQRGADPNRPITYPPYVDGRIYKAFREELCPSLNVGHFDAVHYYINGMTPLHCAVLGGNLKVIQLLVDHGSDPRKVNVKGMRPNELINPTESDSGQIFNILKHGLERIERKQKDKLRESRLKNPLEAHLRKYLVGQDGAINALSSAIRRKLNGWTEDGRQVVWGRRRCLSVSLHIYMRKIQRHLFASTCPNIWNSIRSRNLSALRRAMWGTKTGAS